MLVTLLVLVLLSAGCAAFCCGGRAPFFWLRRCGLTHSLAGQPWLRGPPFSGRHFFGSPKKMPPQQRKDGRVLVLLRSPGLFISVTLKKSCNNKKQKCKDHKKRSTKTSHLTRSEDFFCQFFWFFFVNCLAFSCFFLLFLWFSEHALLVLPVVLLWWEFFSVYFSGFFGEFCWFSASDGLSAAPRVRNRSKSQRATTTHYVQPFVLLQLALGASGRPSLAPTGLKS